MLAHGLVMLFDIAGRNQGLDRLAKEALLADIAAFEDQALQARRF